MRSDVRGPRHGAGRPGTLPRRRTGMPLPCRAVAVFAALTLAVPAAAQTPIDISGITTGMFTPSGVINGGSYPVGSKTLGGIPFLLDYETPPRNEAHAR